MVDGVANYSKTPYITYLVDTTVKSLQSIGYNFHIGGVKRSAELLTPPIWKLYIKIDCSDLYAADLLSL